MLVRNWSLSVKREDIPINAKIGFDIKICMS